MVVLPLVPVTLTIGTSCSEPTGNSMSTIGAATLRGLPTEGDRCMRRPGAALTSITRPPFDTIGVSSVSATMSIPHTSRPMMRATLSTKNLLAVLTLAVTSSAEPPVERLAVRSSWNDCPGGRTESAVRPASASSSRLTAETWSWVMTFSWPWPRRGFLFSIATSSATVCWPSPTTWAGRRWAAATKRPLTTRMRKSLPTAICSTTTLLPYSFARSNATGSCSALFTPTVTPLPW